MVQRKYSVMDVEDYLILKKKGARSDPRAFREDQMNKTDVLNTIQSAHANLEELLAPLNESQLCTPTLEGQPNPS